MTSSIEPRAGVDVLALIDHFAMGGAETVLTRFALEAPRVGIRVTPVCIEPRAGNEAALPLAEAGIEVTCLRSFSARVGPADYSALRRLVKSTRPQLIHTHLGTSDVLGGLVGRELGIPVVSTVHSMQWDPGRTLAVTRAVVKRLASRFIAVSESARQAYLAKGWADEAQIAVIYNGLDLIPAPGDGRAVRRELGLGPDDEVIAMISRLRPEKGYDVAIEAVRLLAAARPKLKLLIVGDGPMRDPILRQSVGLEDRVILPGTRSDVMGILDAADILLHPSQHEALPTTLIEAMAASTPVIATDVGGIPEIITNPEVGTLVPAPADAESVAAALGMLLDDPDRRATIAAAARRSYEDRFTAGPSLSKTRELYDEVIAEHRTRRGESRRQLAPSGRHDLV
jgi:glycosyltransferase involved in cell wall biosynthesis